MTKIVISYRREDSGVITGRIFDRLVARYGRAAIFRDIDNIPIGDDFRVHIDQVLGASDVVLAVVGPGWVGPAASQNRLRNDADPVRVEIEAALHKGAPLIPVLVLGATMPTVAQLPESLKDFAYRNAIQLDAGQDFDVHMSRLIRAVDRILGLSVEAPQDLVGETSAVRTKPAPERHRVLIAGSIAAVLSMTAVAGWYVVLDRPKSLPTDTGSVVANVPAPPAVSLTSETPPLPLAVPAPPPIAAVAPPPAPAPAGTAVPAPRPAKVPAPYRELQRMDQSEARDAAGKISVEAATIHVLSCDGPGGNGARIYLYEYANRPAFRAIAPPNWGTALGGRDFPRFEDAARAGCGAAPAAAAK